MKAKKFEKIMHKYGLSVYSCEGVTGNWIIICDKNGIQVEHDTLKKALDKYLNVLNGCEENNDYLYQRVYDERECESICNLPSILQSIEDDTQDKMYENIFDLFNDHDVME
jgi:hypothetical protein